MENDFFGLSKSAVLAKEYAQKYGSAGLHIDGHSRGSLTIDNAFNSLMKSPNTQGLLSKTTVNLYGPAANVKNLDNKLAYLQGRENISDEIQKYFMKTMHETHFADPVSRLIGGNLGTGGEIPPESSFLQKLLDIYSGKILCTIATELVEM